MKRLNALLVLFLFIISLFYAPFGFCIQRLLYCTWSTRHSSFNSRLDVCVYRKNQLESSVRSPYLIPNWLSHTTTTNSKQTKKRKQFYFIFDWQQMMTNSHCIVYFHFTSKQNQARGDMCILIILEIYISSALFVYLDICK